MCSCIVCFVDVTYDNRDEKSVVGHMPQELSKIAFYFTSEHGGSIEAKVTDAKFHRSTSADGMTFKCESNALLNKTYCLAKNAVKDINRWKFRLNQL